MLPSLQGRNHVSRHTNAPSLKTVTAEPKVPTALFKNRSVFLSLAYLKKKPSAEILKSLNGLNDLNYYIFSRTLDTEVITIT